MKESVFIYNDPKLKRATMHKLLLILTLVLSAAAQTTPASANITTAAITAVLRAQVAAWNHHDLNAFMSGYWNSSELTFFSGGHENHGWQQALDHYRATYASPGHDMGKLEFANLRVEPLGPDAAFVRGEYHLTMPDGKTPHGLFTLIFRKFPDGWKIIHDHSSAAE
jgi:uncharacterized protein (TIGR02246 family)